MPIQQKIPETWAGESEATVYSGPRAIGEDWCAVALGLFVVCLAFGLFASGSSLNWLAAAPTPWSSAEDLAAQLGANWTRYATQFLTMCGLFSFAAWAMGQKPVAFAGGFAVVYALSFMASIAGAWDAAQAYNIEPSLIALVLGMAIANAIRTPRALAEAFRVEFYIKTGIVLLGATLPITLIVWAGPIAFAQASIVSVVTFLTIYHTALFLDLDRKLAALLGVGGAVCGVSAVIAIAGTIRARREHLSIALASVVSWSIVLIVVLPWLARAWYLPAGVGGAWIGTSELADAAGFAAANTYAAFARSGAVSGTPDQAIWAFTLVKVVGRDMWIGIWVVILSFVSMTRWETPGGQVRVDRREIWRRFPKFILGLFAAAALATLASQGHGYADFETVVRPAFIAPLNNLRGWIFTFSFLSIGLTMRLSGLAPAGGNAFIAFATGVMINIVLGFVLSALVFPSYWGNLMR